MDHEVRVERVTPRPLAAIGATTTHPRLAADIRRLLDMIWPVLREQRVRTGHNVVVYRPGEGGALHVLIGVEAFSEFEPSGDIQRTSTPSGEVATVAHFGEYSDMAGAYNAIDRWFRDSGRRPGGVSWEVYGDWEDDPALRRTDIHVLLAPEPEG